MKAFAGFCSQAKLDRDRFLLALGSKSVTTYVWHFWANELDAISCRVYNFSVFHLRGCSVGQPLLQLNMKGARSFDWFFLPFCVFPILLFPIRVQHAGA
jgi:hypothetical protein